ncbi:MAG: glycosyltransferase family 2 protein [Actinobacteria bacterium]|nr:glycosyltransferase family 2 protein [Actinomycetota bacterium]
MGTSEIGYRSRLPDAGSDTRGSGEPPTLVAEAAVKDLERTPGERREIYVRLPLKIVAVFALALTWAGVSLWISIPWIEALGESITLPLAAIVVAGIAIIPGYLNANLAASLLIDRPPPLRFDLAFPAITVVIACFEEEATIEETLDYLLRADYPGALRVIVADDGSSDRTVEIARRRAGRDRRVTVLELPHGGKAKALTTALEKVRTPLMATVDADTLLMPSSLRRGVARLLISPPDTVAVAGAVFVRNSRRNVITKVQEWDYFLGIASVKRQQGLFQGTMVAQGAFSVYRTAAVREAGGWPDRIGEDIVLTWAMMRAGGRIGYERTAIAFTGAPADVARFARQRRRWARGMIEGLREHGGALIAAHRTGAHGVAIDFVFPFVDLVYSIAFPIGLVLALFGNFAIVGPMTVAVVPLNLALAAIMYRLSRRSFAEVGLKVRRNRLGFLGYLLTYQLFMSPISVAGYGEELFRTNRSW